MSERGARHTLLLRLAGPMQAWGTTSRYSDRDTGYEPSKSGVLGLLCAAKGWDRNTSLKLRFVRLRLGVRVDRPGVWEIDYQTAGGWHLRVDEDYGVALADASGQRTIQSVRHYLADASFLVGLEGGDDQLALLHELDEAVRWPVWPLYLGRKAYPPGQPVALPANGEYRDGVRAGVGLIQALRDEPPWPCPGRKAMFVIETSGAQGAQQRLDQPEEGPAFAHRRFLPRYVVSRPLGVNDPIPEEV